MFRISRRGFLKLGAAAGAAVAVKGAFGSIAEAMELKTGGKSVSRKDKQERVGIPSVCLQCVTTCGIIGFVENGRLVKIEGNPEHPNNRGRICAKGQAGINQVYDPDRILYPMKRVGKRGEGKWKRISWDEALNEVAGKLRAVRESGKPEEFFFHYGRNRTQGFTDRFTKAFGTPSVFNHTAICEASKQVAQELMWGKSLDVNDVVNTKLMINFGCNVYEAHTNHTPFSQRVIDGRVENGARLVTFDVRLSNTAARSDEWFPIKPGTDGLVALAMANVIMQEGLYDPKFITEWTNVTPEQLAQHLAQYTPEFAEKESGVPAKDIIRLAREFATTKPATTISYRGACAHHGGAQNERAILMLNAITGNIDVKGGACLPRTGNTKGEPDPKPGEPKAKSGIKEYWKKNFPFAAHGVNQTVLPLVKEGVQKCSVYMTYVYNPVYSNPDGDLQASVLLDEKLVPYHVAIDAYMGEATALADIILPDATYLERWDPETTNSYAMVPFVALRQPVIKPLGESRGVRDILYELARRIGGGMEQYFNYGSAEEYCKVAVSGNAGLDWEELKKKGVWYDKSKKPSYKDYLRELKPEDLEGTKVDEKWGDIYKEKEVEKEVEKEIDGQKVKVKEKVIEKTVIGRMFQGKAVKGFPTSKLKKTSIFEIFSEGLEKAGLGGLPTYMPVPEIQGMKAGELIMTTFKVNVHTQSRTANCKWLTEIAHENPLWIHPDTAASLGLEEGDEVEVKSKVKSMRTKVHLTEGIHPQVVAFAMGMGHTEYGRIAKAQNFSSKGAGKDAGVDLYDPDTNRIWWAKHGNGWHLNPLVPVHADPVGGNQAWMSTIVTVKKV